MKSCKPLFVLLPALLALSLVPRPVQAVEATFTTSTWLEAKRAELLSAQEAIDAAAAAVTAAKEKVSQLGEDIATQEAAVDAAATQAAETSRALSTAEDAAKAADQAKTEAQAASDAAADKVTAAQEEVDALQATLDGDTSQQEQAVTDAQAAVDAAKEDLDAAQSALAQLEAQRDEGSLGFFASVGATDAVDAIKNAPKSASLTDPSDPADATSLDNMKASLTWMSRLNEIRSALGLPELQVSDLLMAYAQADANYSDTQLAHAMQFDDLAAVGNIYGENVAWNAGSDPFDQWYDEEKALFDEAYRALTGSEDVPTGADACAWYDDAANASAMDAYLEEAHPGEGLTVGHYLNTICPDFSTTGFAICTRGSMHGWQTYAQYFGGDIEGSMSVDAYQARLLAYCDELETSIADAEADVTAAKEALAAATEQLAQAQQALADSEAARQEAAEQLPAAQEALAQAQQEAADAEEALAAAKQESDEAAAAVDAAKKSYQSAKASLVAETYLLVQLEQEKDAAEAEEAAAEQALTDAQAAYEAIVAELAAATDLSQAEAVTVEIEDVTYNGAEQTPVPRVVITMPDGEQVTLAQGVDFSVAYENNVNAGDASVSIAGLGEKGAGTWWGEATQSFAIAPKDLVPEMVTAVGNVTYSGEEAVPQVTLTDGNNLLVEGTDFSLACKEGVANVGTATAVVSGKGNYTGSFELPFEVVAANLADATLEAIADQPWTGKAVEPELTVLFNGKQLKPGEDFDATYADNVAVGTASVSLVGKGNFEGTLAAQFKVVSTPHVSYQTHVQSYGWQSYVKDGAMSGTSGKSKRLEGIKIKLSDTSYEGSIEYCTHVQSIGWQDWVADDAMSGTSGRSLRLEAIRIRLTGELAEHYDVWYRVHAQKFGWMGWTKNGNRAGTATYAYRLEAIEIRITPKGSAAPGSTVGSYRQRLLQYQTHVQSYGWQDWRYDGTMSGTSGQSKRLEGIRIKLASPLYGGSIRYRTHIQGIGWESGWKYDGAMSGTSGQSRRLEAIQIELTGEMAERFDVYYRVHAQNFGWMGWAKNGESAGTAGYAYRLEGIQVVLVAKGSAGPGSTAGAYRQK